MLRFFATFLIFSNMIMAAPFVTSDFAKGKDLAEGHQLPLALVFTGSDWSLQSKALIGEIFKEPLQLEMVLVQVDFPEINAQNEAALMQNQMLKEKYGVSHFPTIVVLDAEEKEVARLGYPIEGIADFAHHLKGVGRRVCLLKQRFVEAKKKRAIGELKLCFEEAKSLGAITLAHEIVDEGVEEIPEFMFEKYLSLRGTEEGKALKLKLEKCADMEICSRLALLDFQDEGNVEPLQVFVEKFGREAGERAHFFISEFLDRSEDQKNSIQLISEEKK